MLQTKRQVQLSRTIYSSMPPLHRFPDEHKPIETTPLSATSAEFGLGLSLGLGHTPPHTLLSFSPPSFHTISRAHMDRSPILARNPVGVACTGSISGLLSVNMHALVSPLYYTHTPPLRSTRYTPHTQDVPEPDRALSEVGLFLNTNH